MKTRRFPSPIRSTPSALAALACLTLCGCPPNGGIQTGGGSNYMRTTEQIIRTVSANSAAIDRPIYAQPVNVVADFTDDGGKRRRFNLDGAMLVRKPRDFRLDLKHPLGERVLQVGSNEEDYWAWIVPEVATFWWGRHLHVGKSCSDPIPLRPEQLAEALGINELPEDPQRLVGPIRIYGNQYDRLIYGRAGGGGGADSAEREYWIDRNPPFLIRAVIFHDDFGRRGMSAVLDDYRMLWSGGPYVAHKISVMWPPTDGRGEGARLQLTVDRWGPPRGRISPRAFVRPQDPPAGIGRTVQVDLACDVRDGGGTRSGGAPVYRRPPPTDGPPPGVAEPPEEFRRPPDQPPPESEAPPPSAEPESPRSPFPDGPPPDDAPDSTPPG